MHTHTYVSERLKLHIIIPRHTHIHPKRNLYRSNDLCLQPCLQCTGFVPTVCLLTADLVPGVAEGRCSSRKGDREDSRGCVRGGRKGSVCGGRGLREAAWTLESGGPGSTVPHGCIPWLDP